MTDQANTVSELLPCPFCGSTDIAHDGPCYTQFMCNGCGAATYDQDGHAEAIAAWNRRATADVTEAMETAFAAGARWAHNAPGMREHVDATAKSWVATLNPPMGR